jgi:hypothetical protein
MNVTDALRRPRGHVASGADRRRQAGPGLGRYEESRSTSRRRLAGNEQRAGDKTFWCEGTPNPILVAHVHRKPSEKERNMVVKLVSNDRGNPPGKLADAELHFTDGVLDGLKLIGFGVWERRNGAGRNVTFPARQYSVNGERRSFALLRPILDATAQDRVRDVILQAYAEYEEQIEQTDER